VPIDRRLITSPIRHGTKALPL